MSVGNVSAYAAPQYSYAMPNAWNGPPSFIPQPAFLPPNPQGFVSSGSLISPALTAQQAAWIASSPNLAPDLAAEIQQKASRWFPFVGFTTMYNPKIPLTSFLANPTKAAIAQGGIFAALMGTLLSIMKFSKNEGPERPIPFIAITGLTALFGALGAWGAYSQQKLVNQTLIYQMTHWGVRTVGDTRGEPSY